MLKTMTNPAGSIGKEERCDIHVWSGACDHGDASKDGERYLCDICGSLAETDHEVKHDIGSYVSGDYKNLS